MNTPDKPSLLSQIAEYRSMAERGLFAGRETELIGHLTVLHSQLVTLVDAEAETAQCEPTSPTAVVFWRPPAAVPKEKPIIFTESTGQRRSLDAIRRSDDYNPADHLEGGYSGESDGPRRGRSAHIPVLLVTEFDPGVQDVREQEWRFGAVCAQTDPEVFFTERNQRLIARAKEICGSCAVKAECADYAIENGETDGIWGGMDQDQLRQEAYRRRQPGYQPAAASAPELRLITTESESAA